jgi:hypothetical protein
MGLFGNTGQKLACVVYEQEPERRSAANPLSKDAPDEAL